MCGDMDTRLDVAVETCERMWECLKNLKTDPEIDHYHDLYELRVRIDWILGDVIEKFPIGLKIDD